MIKNPSEHKKRGGNETSPLYSLTVSLNRDNCIVIDHEWINPEKLVQGLKTFKTYDDSYTLAAIINHCKSTAPRIEDELKKLIATV